MSFSDLAYIDATGPHRPDYPTALAFLQDAYRAIYGADVYLEADSQDGQFLALMALMAKDCLDYAGSVYNNMSPSTATGVGLSRVVKINGIRRQIPTFSTADLRIVGQVGTVITNGQAVDTFGNKWNLPASVTIPIAGEITVTATAADIGAVNAGANTINKINTPTLGWQTVNNVLAATPGAPVETDVALRARQKISTALPSQSVMDGIVGGVANVTGVTRIKGYENDTDTTDANGIPPHTISLVAEGGTAQDVADVIARRKTPGTGTYGSTSIVTYDSRGVPNTIRFYRPTVQQIKAQITIKALPGYVTGYADQIKAAVVAAVKALSIGDSVLLSRISATASLLGTPAGATYYITDTQLAKLASALAAANVPILFNEVADALLANITIVVT
jgi:uncharacterized phage protein gp47/JayE